MKMSLKRVLALVLCAAMLFGMLPMQQVKAEDMFIGGFVANNTAELVEALTEAEGMVAPETVVTIQIGEPFELTENVSVPGGCRLDVPVPFTIGAGVTMAVFGNLEVTAEMSNKGTLNNNNNVTVYGNAGGSLAFTETGKYTGTGEMMVINSTYEDIIPGMDLSKVNIEQGEGVGGVCWTITPKEDAELVPDQWGNYSFYTMEELKQLASQTYDSWTWANYAGSETFVIDESISLPWNLPLGSNGAAIEIAEGVVVDVNEGHFDYLVVNGTLNINALQLYTQLHVNGTLNIGSSAYYNWSADINYVEDSINYAENVRRGLYCTSSDVSLRDICLRAKQDPSIQYIYYLQQEETLTEDLTVPETVFLQVRSPLTVAEGVTLTFDAEAVYMQAPVTVYGTLQNNNWANVNYPNAMLTIAEGATYSGDGVLVIHGITEGDPLVAIPGLDTTGYELTNDGWEDGTTWQLVPEGYNPDVNNGLTFTTVEELKALIDQDLDPWTNVYYTGEDSLVIDETIVCPEYLMIHASGCEVRIGENGNLTVQDLYCDKLTVEGTLNVATAGMQTSLNVSGTMNVQDGMYVQVDTELNGLENVCFQNQYTHIFCEYMQVDKTGLLELVEQANQNTDPRWIYVLYLNAEEIVLDQDLVIPSNIQLYLNQPVTVAEGATLTVYCYNVICNETVTVEGTLENNSWIVASAYNNVTITFGDGSGYTGTGTIAVEKDPSVSLESVLPGLDLSSLYLRQDGDYWWYISTTNNNGGGDGNMQTFGSFEELKELATQPWDNWTWIEYTGGDVLEITEDIVLPENLHIQTSVGVRIAEGVNAQFNYLSCNWLEVEGDLYLDHAKTSEYLSVTGSLTVAENLYIGSNANLEGRDKIAFTSEWGGIYREFYNVDLDEFKERIVEAEENAHADSRMHYSIHLTEESIVLEESLTVPSMVNVYFEGPLTVEAGATLTLNSENVQFYAPAIIYGNLENNSWLFVGAFSDATLTFAEGSTYTGYGTIAVEKDPSVSLESVLPGLDLSSLYVRQDGDYWWYISTTQQGGDGGDNLGFSNVEELKELLAQGLEPWSYVSYIGEGPLVIDETIVCSEYIQIGVHGNEVQIGENGNLTVQDLYCDNLVVEGILNVATVNAQTSVKVTGTMNLKDGLHIPVTGTLEGAENICFQNEGTRIFWKYESVNKAKMLDLIEQAKQNTDSRYLYVLQLDTEEIVLDQDLLVPRNVQLYVFQPMTVSAGTTLTTSCYTVNIGARLTIEGAWVNNTWTTVWAAGNEGFIEFKEGHSYTGTGTIAVEKSPETPLESVLPGLDLSSLYIRQDGDYWWHVSTTQQGGGNGLTFSTMEELQALAAESYDWGYMMYVGSEDFVISEDISMPWNTCVDFGEHNVVVSEDVTANFMELMCGGLTVHGTLNADYMYVMGNVVVNGAIKTMHMSINETTSITGLENIKFTNSYNPLSRVYYVNSGEELVAALDKAANPQLPKETAMIQLNGGPVILTEDATLPKNCELHISNDMVIAENATLTVNGMVGLGASLTVQGTLVNNNDIYTWEGRMIIAEGGKYEGRGTLRILGGSDYNTVFQGLNLDDFQISNNYGECRLVYVAGLTPVATPSELEWGYTYKDGVKVALPGAVSWKSGITDTAGTEYVFFYRINEDGSETLVNQYGGVGYNAKNYMEGYNSSTELLLSNIPSGRYYFTVYSQGDYKNTKDSETVISEIWEYTKPDAQLETATNLGWSDDSFRAEWTNPNGEDEVYYALVSWYYKDREDGNMYVFARTISQDDEYGELREYFMAMMGTGYYSYAVQFVSADITKAISSELSERSEWYHLEEMPETPTAQLGGLLNDPTKTDEEKLEEVQNMGTDTLKEIMEENSDAMNILVQMETAVAGGTAQVDVSAEVAEEIVELVVEEISIVGANLNSKEDESQNVTLVIDKVEEVREITGNYDTSTAVQFSMTLDNVKDTKNLEVPVVVTIPVPTGIAADKVVVLHYHDDGTYDVITPEVSIVGGKAYAQFILTSFSDFAILEKLAALLGDVDLNEGVDVDDVLALLWAVLFPDMYPVEVDADYDHNGFVDVDDVLTLLWYVLFPDMYPLENT